MPVTNSWRQFKKTVWTFCITDVSQHNARLRKCFDGELRNIVFTIKSKLPRSQNKVFPKIKQFTVSWFISYHVQYRLSSKTVQDIVYYETCSTYLINKCSFQKDGFYYIFNTVTSHFPCLHSWKRTTWFGRYLFGWGYYYVLFSSKLYMKVLWRFDLQISSWKLKDPTGHLICLGKHWPAWHDHTFI